MDDRPVYKLTAEQQDELKKLREKSDKNDISAMEKERLGELLKMEERMKEDTEKMEAMEAEKGIESLEKSVDNRESLDDFKKDHPEFFNKIR